VKLNYLICDHRFFEIVSPLLCAKVLDGLYDVEWPVEYLLLAACLEFNVCFFFDNIKTLYLGGSQYINLCLSFFCAINFGNKQIITN